MATTARQARIEKPAERQRVVPARELAWVNIDQLCEFDWSDDNKVRMTVRGQIRQVYANGSGVVLYLCTAEETEGNVIHLSEFALAPGCPVKIGMEYVEGRF